MLILNSVFRNCNPFQVDESIVTCFGIDVVALVPFRTVTNECLKDQIVYRSAHTTPSTYQIVEVAVVFAVSFGYSTSPDILDPSLV